jgi:hypothetical protein
MTKELAILDIQKLNVDINIDDVLNIAISKAEDHIHSKINEAKHQAIKLVKEISSLGEEIKKMVTDAAEDQTADAVATLQKGFKLFNKKMKVAIRQDPNDHTEIEVDFNAEVTFLSERPHGQYLSLTFPCKLEDPALYKSKLDLVQTREEHRATVLEEQLEWRRRLSSIDRLERRWRGKLAEKSLSGTEGGKQLLTLLTEGIEDQVKDLLV